MDVGKARAIIGQTGGDSGVVLDDQDFVVARRDREPEELMAAQTISP